MAGVCIVCNSPSCDDYIHEVIGNFHPQNPLAVFITLKEMLKAGELKLVGPKVHAALEETELTADQAIAYLEQYFGV